MKCPKCKSLTSIRESRELLGNIDVRFRKCRKCGFEFKTYEFLEKDCRELIEEHEESTKYNSNTLCWQCKRAYGDCSWSESFVPVKGWNAEPTIIKGNKKEPEIYSYNVKKCPLFIKEKRKYYDD